MTRSTLETRGGPALLIERRLLTSWLGVLGVSAPARHVKFRFGELDAPATDCDRAADLSPQELAVLAVGAGRALVVGGDPGPIEVRTDAQGLLLVRVSVSDGDRFVEDAISRLTLGQWTRAEVVFDIASDVLVLFDASLAGRDALSAGGVVIQTPAGNYAVETTRLDDGRVDLVAHRLIRMSM